MPEFGDGLSFDVQQLLVTRGLFQANSADGPNRRK